MFLKIVGRENCLLGIVRRIDRQENIMRKNPTGCLTQKVQPAEIPTKNRFRKRCLLKLRIKK
jgi:hypothetical protein